MLQSALIREEAARLLLEGGFVEAPTVPVDPTTDIRMFEDALCIVGLVCYSTWSKLEAGWMAAQTAMVTRISEHMSRSDPKSWDGYLALITADEPAKYQSIHQIKYDTQRLRKLVVSGRDLKTFSVKRSLLPVLPFDFSCLDVASRDLSAAAKE